MVLDLPLLAFRECRQAGLGSIKNHSFIESLSIPRQGSLRVDSGSMGETEQGLQYNGESGNLSAYHVSCA